MINATQPAQFEVQIKKVYKGRALAGKIRINIIEEQFRH